MFTMRAAHGKHSMPGPLSTCATWGPLSKEILWIKTSKSQSQCHRQTKPKKTSNGSRTELLNAVASQAHGHLSALGGQKIQYHGRTSFQTYSGLVQMKFCQSLLYSLWVFHALGSLTPLNGIDRFGVICLGFLILLWPVWCTSAKSRKSTTKKIKTQAQCGSRQQRRSKRLRAKKKYKFMKAIHEARLVPCHAQIWSYFAQSRKPTTPIGVNHVTKELGQHSFVWMSLNGFATIWSICSRLFCFLHAFW